MVICLITHPGMTYAVAGVIWSKSLSLQENDVKPSSLCSQRGPLLFSSHILMIPKHFCRFDFPGNALKHKPRNEYQNTLGEIIQGNTVHSHYHFHYCDWWMRNHHLMFTYFAFGVSSCTMESPYLSLVVAPFCIAALLHQRYFHYSPSISMNITLYIRMKH